ncbi:MAG: DUF4402 domain-containing protein [Gammaproteobacteria bacterium]|nr:DUF4402 domain-containing protein [Gammaproteobacteria bacterium]
MKKTNLVLKMSLTALLAGSVGTATADVVDGTATANVIAPLLVTETTAMSFGDVAGGTAAGTVVLDTAGARTITGDANALPSAVGTAGVFTVTGEAAKTFSLAFAAGVLSDGVAAGNNMVVDTFTQTLAATGNALPGVGSFSVGATLHLGASQAAGAYSTANTATGGAPYTVTANYE